MRSMIPRGDPNSFWFFTPLDDPVEAAYNPFGWQRKIDLDAKPLAVKVVQLAVDAFVVPLMALHIARMQKT
jgi:hypothetical protein